MGTDSKHIETAVNQTYPGLTMYVRDVNLPDEISKKYKKTYFFERKPFAMQVIV